MRLGPRGRRSFAGLLALLALAVVMASGSACGPPAGGVLAAKRIAWAQLQKRGWAPQAQCLVDLWQAESSWNVYALNPATGAYGIPQALPARRMASAGSDWLKNPSTQIRWGLTYIGQRYGGPCNAWHYWQAHHWYVKSAPTTPATPTASAAPPTPATAVVRATRS
jgi:hypothetical protein